MLRLHFNKVILFAFLIPYVTCAQGVKEGMPEERKKPILTNVPPKPIGNGEYIVGTEKELTTEEWKQLLQGFGIYQLELIVKFNPAYKVTFSNDPGLEKLKMELKQNPTIRYVEENARLEKKIKN
ncbi:hypothetical protein [Leptospira kanakyensis]|uniref:hypothetical protein n=1 Tax=Leptospira kanakyensis TaxID=2484968 RepID=UPI00223DA586|nr:hypothetical protein [Leptospira kanakyensis]MCW7483029.1 hypothetical protein [Leptospira kanakyensis]